MSFSQNFHFFTIKFLSITKFFLPPLMAKIVIKKAKGYNQIAPKIIKWASYLFAPILLVIFNKCIDLGYYPENMKIGEVAPIYKKGDQDGESNYRPITVLTQFNQI